MEHNRDAADSIRLLRAVGLSAGAAAIYMELATRQRGLAARHINEYLKLSKPTLFRALNELVEKGFITRQRIVHERSYRAEALSDALTNYALYQRQLLQPVQKALNHLPDN